MQAHEVLGSEGLCPWFNSLDAVWKFFLSVFFSGCVGSSLLLRLSSGCGGWGGAGRGGEHSPATVFMLLITVASLVAEHGLQDV